ncbi:MAG: hypothetical protein ACRD5D_02785 [Candidatus Polarisedimenticolia bacterium]
MSVIEKHRSRYPRELLERLPPGRLGTTWEGVSIREIVRRSPPLPRAAFVMAQFMDSDRPGFWERNGHHDRGDPWKEERHRGD